MTEKKRKPYGLGERARLSPDAAFTMGELRQVLRDTIGDLNMPDDLEVKKLANIITGWRGQFWAAQEAREFREVADRARAAIGTLAEAMKAVLQHHQSRVEMGDPFAQPRASSAGKILAAINEQDVAYAVGTDAPVESNPDKFHERVADWRWLAEVMPVDFATALQKANPGKRIGVSKDGPCARFLAAIIPRVTGESPSASAVGTQLIMRRGVPTGDIG